MARLTCLSNLVTCATQLQPASKQAQIFATNLAVRCYDVCSPSPYSDTLAMPWRTSALYGRSA